MTHCTKIVNNKVVLDCKFARFACNKYVCKEPSRVEVSLDYFGGRITEPFHAWGGAQCPQYKNLVLA